VLANGANETLCPPCAPLARCRASAHNRPVPRYVIERLIDPGLSKEESEDLAGRSAMLLATEYTELHWEHSHGVVLPDGRLGSFCIYAAPDRETVYAHAEAIGGHEIIRIMEISGDYSPADFPL
jgi:hypothetical protein